MLRTALHARIANAMISDDSSGTSWRRLLHLPRVAPDSVQLITDERLCERAAREYYRDRLGPRPVTGVAVVRVGDMYLVYGIKHAGEWAVLEVYTRDFEYLTANPAGLTR